MTHALGKTPASQVDYLNPHATSTPVGDAQEAKAIQKVFGENVPPLSASKSMTGHALGAAGVHEAIFCLLMMNGGFMAPSINIQNLDPVFADLPIVRTPEQKEVSMALSNNFGFGGTNACLLLSKV